MWEGGPPWRQTRGAVKTRTRRCTPSHPRTSSFGLGCHGYDDSKLWLVTFAQGGFGDRLLARLAWAVKAGRLGGSGFNCRPLVPAPALREDRVRIRGMWLCFSD